MSSNDNKGGLLTFYWISEREHGKQTQALGTKFLCTNHYLHGSLNIPGSHMTNTILMQ